MTERRRIILNVAATYGRSLFAIACGLFSGRWALMALGEVDYGLYGVVGGLAGFISLINGLLADAVGRFYAYAVGQARANEASGVDTCRKWFNTALVIHTALPVVLVSVGYPAGKWLIENWLSIPGDRLGTCVLVFRFVCATCFVGMVNVPFAAMYRAKQYIAELTVYSVLQTALNVVFMYYMVTHPRRWLGDYACWNSLLSIVPYTVISIRACWIFPECRFRAKYLISLDRLRILFKFAAYRFGGALSAIVSQQGMSLLINKLLGPAKNSAMSVASSVAGHSQTFAGSLTSALYPAVTNACGEGDFDKMRKLSYASCKFSALFVLVFALPLMVEIEEVMVLWLKTPPSGAAALCWCLIAAAVLENITSGHYMAIFSVGDIKMYQLLVSVAGLAALPLAGAMVVLGLGILGVGVALILSGVAVSIVRLIFGRKVGTMSPVYWVKHVLTPVASGAVISYAAGWLATLTSSPSALRALFVSTVVDCIFVSWCFAFVLEHNEKTYLLEKMAFALRLRKQ